MAATVDAPPDANISRGRIWILIVLLLAGLGVRWLWYPARFEQRNGDEPAYLYDGLLLFEGIVPGHKAVPSGLMTWVEWSYVAGQSAINLIHPTAAEKQISIIARPLYVMNRTIFNDYRDISGMRNYVLVWNVIFGLVGIIAAWKFGEWASGEWGAILCAGLIALAPVLGDVTGQARPLAIAIAMVMVCFALMARRRYRGAAICIGIALGTRIEMLLLLPLVVAMVIEQVGWRDCWKILFKCIGLALVAFMVVSPWWLMTWFGNIRSIVGVRLMSVSQDVPHLTLLKQLTWTNALLIPILLLFASIAQTWRRKRGWMMPLAALLIVATMLVGHSNISYQIAPILATIVLAAMGISVLPARAKPIIGILIVASLVLAAGQSVYESRTADRIYLTADTTDWIERHVPPGTIVYWPAVMCLEPLPTVESANRMWNEVMDDNAWRTKLGWAVSFHTSADNPMDLPRVTSEEILYKERANVRLWFILGGRSEVKLPRFDIRQTSGSSFFGVPGSADAFKKTGGVYVLLGHPDPTLGSPVITWQRRATRDVSIYVSPDVKLIP